MGLVAGDLGYENDGVRVRLLDGDIGPNIPSKANHLEPIELDADTYRERSRGAASPASSSHSVAWPRQDKLGQAYLIIVHRLPSS